MKRLYLAHSLELPPRLDDLAKFLEVLQVVACALDQLLMSSPLSSSTTHLDGYLAGLNNY